jgi:hypothetical protein
MEHTNNRITLLRENAEKHLADLWDMISKALTKSIYEHLIMVNNCWSSNFLLSKNKTHRSVWLQKSSVSYELKIWLGTSLASLMVVPPVCVLQFRPEIGYWVRLLFKVQKKRRIEKTPGLKNVFRGWNRY